MLSNKKSNNNLLLFIALICYLISILFHLSSTKPTIQISKQESINNINSDFIRFISIGNKRLISDLIWIQTLLESDEEKYKKNDLNNWMFHRFNLISILEPDFYYNYYFGGMYLSIIKDDLPGAAYIYEKGLKLFPNDYKLNFNSGFNYYFEMRELDKGLEKFLNIENHPDLPRSIRFVIEKIKFNKSNDFDSTLSFLIASRNNTNDRTLIRKLESDIYALKATRDLNCLNEKKMNCENLDAYGESYLFKNGKWITQKPFTPYKIHFKKQQ